MSRRLVRELLELNQRPVDFATAGPIGEDINKWNVVIVGPPNTPYDGGAFRLKLRFPEEYPFKPPTVKFLTKIYHPNVTCSDGEVCPALLAENWAPHLNIRYILETLRTLLLVPNGADPMDEEVGREFNLAPAEFSAKAAKWTRTYATAM